MDPKKLSLLSKQKPDKILKEEGKADFASFLKADNELAYSGL